MKKKPPEAEKKLTNKQKEILWKELVNYIFVTRGYPIGHVPYKSFRIKKS